MTQINTSERFAAIDVLRGFDMFFLLDAMFHTNAVRMFNDYQPLIFELKQQMI